MKELNLTEGRATGIPKILRAMKGNGSLSPEFEFDEDHTYFLVRLPAHPEARHTTEYEAVLKLKSGVESGVESEMAILILNDLRESEPGKKAMGSINHLSCKVNGLFFTSRIGDVRKGRNPSSRS